MKRQGVVLRTFIIMYLIMVASLFAGCSKSIEQQIAEQLKLGQKYLAEANYEEAIVAFNKVIEIDDKEIEAYYGLLDTYTKTTDIEKTIETVDLIESVFSDEEYDKERLVNAINQLTEGINDGEDIRKLSWVILEIKEDNVDAYKKLAKSYADEGNYGEAIKILEEGREICKYPFTEILQEYYEIHKQNMYQKIKDKFGFAENEFLSKGAMYTDFNGDGLRDLFAHITDKNNIFTLYFCSADLTLCEEVYSTVEIYHSWIISAIRIEDRNFYIIMFGDGEPLGQGDEVFLGNVFYHQYIIAGVIDGEPQVIKSETGVTLNFMNHDDESAYFEPIISEIVNLE